MVTHGEIFDYLCKKYPLETACSFDNPGFLVGDRKTVTKKAVVSLDCDKNTIDYALSVGANLIITHHPVIYDPLKNVTEGSVVYKALNHKISVISMHTNLDMGGGGVNDCLCEALELDGVKKYVAADGFILRSANVKTTADKFAEHIKSKLGFSVRYVGNGEIRRLLVCSGSGGDYIDEAIASGFDGLIAADIKHKIFIKAINNNFAVFDCGHYASENVVVLPLTNLLQKKFKNTVFLPHNNDMIKFI